MCMQQVKGWETGRLNLLTYLKYFDWQLTHELGASMHNTTINVYQHEDMRSSAPAESDVRCARQTNLQLWCEQGEHAVCMVSCTEDPDARYKINSLY